MYRLLTFGILLMVLQFGLVAENEECELEEIEAVDDFTTTFPDEPLTFNLLENDLGDGVRLIEIVESPQCGEIVDWSEDGEVVYIADGDTNCAFDTFIYEIEGNCGNKDTAIVTIFIEQISGDLIVEVEQDCINLGVTGVYELNLVILGGVPPYIVNMNGIQNTLEETGNLNYTVCEYDTYEVSVIDGTESEFYESNEVPCFSWLNWCKYTPNFDYETSCLGNGEIAIKIESEYLEASYTDNTGKKYAMNRVDTIPTVSYLNVQISGCIYVDTLLNCLSANDDFVEVLEGESITSNVLDNDFGQNIRVASIVTMPECGTLLDWSPNGIINYRMTEGEECTEDEVIYELANSIGEITLASIHFHKITKQEMYLDWEVTCDDSNCEFNFAIIGGVAPYYVFGSFNDMIESNTFDISTSCGGGVELEILDSMDEMLYFELYTYDLCYGDEDCYEPKFTSEYFEIDCLGDLGVVVDFRLQPTLLERAFWIGSDNQYHELQELDTIPNHSYYYLELKYMGHIDGYVDCLMTDVKVINEKFSNVSLQLYPNPNNGEFFLQLDTEATLSLQSFPIRVYDITGRLVWNGEAQGNRLQTLELGNVQSGLYVLQVVLEDGVVVERFLVE